MKRTKTVSLVAALSIILAGLVTLVSPIVDEDRGTSPFHILLDRGVVSASFAKNESTAQSNTNIYESRSNQPLDPCDHDGEVSHMDGAHSHMMAISTSAAIDFSRNLSFIASSPVLQFKEGHIPPPAKPPRIST